MRFDRVHPADAAVVLRPFELRHQSVDTGGIAHRRPPAGNGARYQNQRTYPPRIRKRVVDGDAAALRTTDNVQIFDAKILDNRFQVRNVTEGFVGRNRLAETAPVVGHALKTTAQMSNRFGPHAAVGDTGMKHYNARTSAACLDTEQCLATLDLPPCYFALAHPCFICLSPSL